jgi:endonuclease VIII
VPEGDAVWRTARRLHQALSGRTLVRSDFRVPAIATADLSGGAVEETVSRGKHLLTRIDAQSAGGARWTLHTHLKMEGSWRVYDRGQRWDRAGHLARVVLDTGDRIGVGFQLGVVELVLREHEDQVVGHLGPDLLGPDWDEHEAVRRLTADPMRPLGEALLDQRNLAGIGAIYRTELCFLTGYDPRSPVGVVTDPVRMVRLARSMLDQNRHVPQICTTGDKRRGRNLWVHGRQGEGCLRCGTPISSAELGEPDRKRAAYWCPSCQPPR